MAETVIKVKKEIQEEVSIPVPSYWKHKKKTSDNIFELYAVISPEQVLNVWIMKSEKPSASISVRSLNMVSEFATGELEEIGRDLFEISFNAAQEIHENLLK